jgi:hypothetical protein
LTFRGRRFQRRIYWFDDYERAATFGSDDDPRIEGYFDVTDYRIATQKWREVRASRLPNINMLDRVPSLNNNDPLLPSHHSQYIDLIEELGEDAGNLLRAAGVTQVYGQVPDGWQGENPAAAPYTGVVRMAWLVPDGVWLDSDEETKDALRDPAWNPVQTVILAGESDEAHDDSLAGGEVAVLESKPTERRYRVTADGAGYLVIAETWYPGWTATVNGRKATLYRADLAFQAVRVFSGESGITLSYKPRYWASSVAASVLSLGVILALIFSASVRVYPDTTNASSMIHSVL